MTRLVQLSAIAVLTASTTYAAPQITPIDIEPVPVECLTPDCMDGPCWERVKPKLPKFPKCELPSSNICWDECELRGDNKTVVNLSEPFESPCGQFRSELTVTSSDFGPLVGGVLVMDYTRTWKEFSPNGEVYQVWRLAAKIDMFSIASEDVPVGCPPGLIPRVLATNQTAFYYGYVDYARNCETQKWACVIVLFHNCDLFIHDPATSCVPGVFDPTSTYAIVAPNSPANPFTPSINSAQSGPVFSDAVRNVANNLPLPFCYAEENIREGVMELIIELCLCPLTNTPPQVSLRAFKGEGTCFGADGRPSSFATIDTSPFGLPWFNLHTTSIGNWNDGDVYPGKEICWVDEGVFTYHDSCVPDDSIEWFYGGSTAEGWEACSLDPDNDVITQNFTDLADNFSGVIGGPINPPFVGKVFQTDHLIYVNY